jgi:DNA-directed RNA polymerase specialized sigma24 family protein
MCGWEAQNVAQIFDHCLDLTAGGATPAECLARHPQFADELAGLLQCVGEHPSLAAALLQLSSEQRAVVMLRCFGDRDEGEIAALTGRSVASIRLLQQQAVAALADALSDAEGKARHHAA